MDQHVTARYLTWLAQGPEERRAVDAHLAACPACADYYRAMTQFLTEAGGDERHLIPDPHLPERIAAIAAAPREHRGSRTVLRWSMAGAFAVLALAIGVSLGEAIAPAPAATDAASEFVDTYYNAVSQQSFSARLETVVPSTGGEAR